jgi:hypothetical protein
MNFAIGEHVYSPIYRPFRNPTGLKFAELDFFHKVLRSDALPLTGALGLHLALNMPMLQTPEIAISCELEIAIYICRNLCVYGFWVARDRQFAAYAIMAVWTRRQMAAFGN